MAKPDPLFLLVKSLSASEKALVRQSDKGQASYMALFDWMSRVQDYDERKAKKKLLDGGHDVNFSYAKNYLTKHILRVLRENEDAGTYATSRLVQEIELLVRRKVFEMAQKMLVKAKEKAFQEDRFQEWLSLSSIEISLVLQDGGKVEENLESIEDINKGRKEMREKLVNLSEFEDLYYSYRPLVKRKQSARNEWDLALLQKFSSHPLLSSLSNAQSRRAMRYYYLCKTFVHVYSGDYTAATADLKASIGLYQEVNFLAEDHPEGYLTDLVRLGGMQLYYKEYDEVQRLLGEIKAFNQRKGIHESESFERYYRLLLNFALQTRRFEIVKPELEAIGNSLVEFEASLPWDLRSTLILQLGQVYFEQQQYKQARQWFNVILDHPNRHIREDVTSLARILMIFIYFETGDADLAEANSKSTRKYLLRHQSLYKFEARVLRFLEQHSFEEKGSAIKAAIQTLRTDLQAIFQDPLEATILNYFDVIAWLDAKIKRLG